MEQKITLTVHIALNELDALKYACAHTDEKLYIHESIGNAAMLTVTIEVRSAELLFYLVRSFEARLEYDKACESTRKAIGHERNR